MGKEVSIFWFRRDLRLDDNAGLKAALQGDFPVLPIFIFDPEILDSLPEDDARVSFIFERLQSMRNTLQEEHGSSVAMYHGTPEKIFKQLLKEHAVQKVFTNRDYEPYAKERDEKIRKILEKEAVEFCDFKDQVIFEKDEITKQDGDPYVVYTPYKNTWISKFNNTDLEFHYTSRYTNNYIQNSRLPNLTLADIGFKKSSIEVPDYQVTPGLVKDYEKHGISRQKKVLQGWDRICASER